MMPIVDLKGPVVWREPAHIARSGVRPNPTIDSRLSRLTTRYGSLGG